MPVGNVFQSYCTACDRNTNQEIVAEVSTEDEDQDIWWRGQYQVIKCRGCNFHSFRVESICSEDYEPNNSFTPTVTVYPAREFKKAEEFELPAQLSAIYRESVQAVNMDARTLCAVGLRALVEGLCLDQGITDGPVTRRNGTPARSRNLDGKINGLHERQLITGAERDALHNLRFLGNDAAHQLDSPTKRELQIAFQIIEHVFRTVFDVEDLSSRSAFLRNRRQTRP